MLSFALISYKTSKFICNKNTCSSSEGVHSTAKEKIHKNLQLSELTSSQMHKAEAVSDPRVGPAHRVCPQLPHTCASELISGTDVSSSN